MKLIKLSEEHYIVVDDSEVKEGDLVRWRKDYNVGQIVNNAELNWSEWQKVTHSTQPLEWFGGEIIFLSEVKELVGEVDKAFERYPVIENDKDHNDRNYYRRSAYYQALEDNKERKYTREDLLDAFTWGFLEGTERGDVTDGVNKFSQSLQPKTEWEVEIVDGKLKLI